MVVLSKWRVGNCFSGVGSHASSKVISTIFGGSTLLRGSGEAFCAMALDLCQCQLLLERLENREPDCRSLSGSQRDLGSETSG